MKQNQVIAYTRVSTQDQGTHGHGLDLQMTSITAYTSARGYEVVCEFSDICSGEESIQDRKGLSAAIEKSKAENIPIIVDGLDRFSRITKTLEDLVLNNNLKVFSTRSGEKARGAVLAAEAARAQAERERISSTTKAALQKLKEAGRTLGNPTNLPEAQQRGAAANRLKSKAQTNTMLPIIDEIKASGATARKEIVERLNSLGYRTPRGGLWTIENNMALGETSLQFKRSKLTVVLRRSQLILQVSCRQLLLYGPRLPRASLAISKLQTPAAARTTHPAQSQSKRPWRAFAFVLQL
eukprot:gene19733-25664_t